MRCKHVSAPNGLRQLWRDLAAPVADVTRGAHASFSKSAALV